MPKSSRTISTGVKPELPANMAMHDAFKTGSPPLSTLANTFNSFTLLKSITVSENLDVTRITSEVADTGSLVTETVADVDKHDV